MGIADVYALISQAATAGAERGDQDLTLRALQLALHYQMWIGIDSISVEQREYPYYRSGSSFPEAMFTLVPADHWAYNAMRYLQEQGLLSSYARDYFPGSELRTHYQFGIAVEALLKEFALRKDDPAFSSDGPRMEQLEIMLETLRAEFSEQIC